MKRLSFITRFKIEFLLSFTSCRKVLGKMPAQKLLSEMSSQKAEETRILFIFNTKLPLLH